jgi:hypothetical protein
VSIYIPYFYVIEEYSTGILYAGSKWASDANPDKFMIKGGYLTSSNIINLRILENGIESFKIRKIKTFISPKSAYDYETKFLNKVNAKKNSRFYNKHNNDKITPGTCEFETIMLEKYGVKNVMQHPDLYMEWVRSFQKKHGVTNPYQLPHIKQKGIDTRLERYGYKYFNHDLVRDIVVEKYGVENVSQLEWVKDKKKSTTLHHYGVENPFQSEEIKTKIKETNLEKYGADNFMKTDHGKTVFKNLMNEKYGVDNFSKTDEFRTYNKQRLQSHHSRPIIATIKSYQQKYNLHFGRGWTNRNDEKLQIMLDDLVQKYGVITK